MFKGERYITSGISIEIPFSIQDVIWKLIDEMKVKKDYLQIFKLVPKSEGVLIVHSQEQPEYKEEYIIENIDISSEYKIYVIDDGEYSTLMLADEY